jgi:hypothetical protein
MSFDPTAVDPSVESSREASLPAAAGSRANRWHPSRLLVAEEWVCAGLLATVGLVYLYAWMPKPSVPPAVAAAVARLKDPFSREARSVDPPVRLMEAARPVFAAIQRAERLEAHGQFDETTRRAWKQAADEVRRLGFKPIATGNGRHVRLFMKEAEADRMIELEAVLEELMPGHFAALEAERQAAIERGEGDIGDPLPAVTWLAAADTAPEAVRGAARNLALMHAQAASNIRLITRLRETVGYESWRATCAAGASMPGLAARAAMWRAEFGCSQAAFDRAKELYESGFALWREACAVVPELGQDPVIARELRDHEAQYREVLATLGGTAPAGDPGEGSLDL